MTRFLVDAQLPIILLGLTNGERVIEVV